MKKNSCSKNPFPPGSFGVFEINPESYTAGELSFVLKDRTFPISTKGNLIEKADDSITLRDENGSRNGDEILFIHNWKIHVYKLDNLTQRIENFLHTKNQERVQIDEKPYQSKLFHDYFACNYDYGTNLKVTKDEFQDIYLNKLAEPHDSSLWSKLVSKLHLYGEHFGGLV